MNATVTAGAHQTESFGLGCIDRQRTDGEVGTGINVMLDESAVVHAVQLIARKDQIMINIPFLKQPLVFADGISRSFKPTWTVRSLLGSQDFNEPLPETGRQVEGHGEVPVQ